MPIHGWVNFDKPEGMTSTAAVGKIRRLFNAQKAGHAGTLDPLAQGILPIALGSHKNSSFYDGFRENLSFHSAMGAGDPD